jgi:hypothetical protein
VCTATVVPLGDGFSLAFNRDEQRDRPPATRPALYRLKRRVAVFPIDPLGGGTWIAVNDVGLAAALLNRTVTPHQPRKAPCSRGLIIPRVLESQSLAEALDTSAGLDASQFNLFRLLLIHEARAAIATSTAHAVSIEQIDITNPYMLTSSSLGDAVVEAPRTQLFRQSFTADEQSWRDAQIQFHSHRWPDRPEVSVNMERADAQTVSQSFINVSSRAIRFLYRALQESSAAGIIAT